MFRLRARRRNAAGRVHGAVQIVDIKMAGAVLTKRVKLSNNTCVDETVDTFTGRLLSRKPAPCVKF